MIKERIRTSDRVAKEVSIARLNMSLTKIRTDGKEKYRENLTELVECIARVIVSFTKEEVGKEWTRNNSVANARKFDAEVMRVLERKCGHYESLWVDLVESDIGSKSSLFDTLHFFHKIAVVNKDTLSDLMNRGPLIMAQLLHICGMTDIDVRSF